jgi:hypothetical protein
MLFVPFVALAVAATLFIIGRVMASKASLIKGARMTTVAELAAEAASIGGGASGFVGLSGKAVCDQPLKAELSETPCVHYQVKVVREYEEAYTTTGSDGSNQTQTRRGMDNVALNTRSCPFAIDDGTGSVAVDAAGAEYKLATTVERYEPGETLGTIGAFVLSEMIAGAGRRTIGYRLEEKCLPLGRMVYAFGEAGFENGKPILRKGGERGSRLIVSVESGEQLARSAGNVSLWLTIVSGVALAAAALLEILILIKR